MDLIKLKVFKNVNIKKVFDIGLFFYFILNQIHYIFSFTGLLQLIVVGAINLIGIVMLITIIFKKMDKRILIVLSILMFFGGLSFVFIGNFNISVYVTVLRYLGIVMYLLYYKQNPKVMTVIMYATLFLFIPVLFSKLGYNMFSKSSRNYYSIILFMVNFVHNKSFWDVKKRAPIFPTIASWFISIFAGGRGGIITYGIFFVGTLINNFKYIKENPKSKTIDNISDTQEVSVITDEMLQKNKKANKESFINQYKKEVLTILIIFLVFSLIFVFKYTNKKYNLFDFKFQNIVDVLEDNITDSSYGFENKALRSEARVSMMKKYLKHMFGNANYFVNGVDLKIEEIFVKYHFNVHNSYMALHSKFGIGGVILCAYLGFRALYIIIRKKEWGHLLVYVAILLRVFIDTAAFPGHLDIIIFYYFFRFYNIDFNKADTKDINKRSKNKEIQEVNYN